MSADRWNICPQCRKGLQQRREEVILLLEAEYGKVTLAEYTNLLEQKNDLEDKRLDNTLREDYSFTITSQDMLAIAYTCSCSVCKFTFHYEHVEPIPMDGSPRMGKLRLNKGYIEWS